MTRIDSIRSEIMKRMRATPFRPFALTMESGDRVMIGHPENIAFDPGSPAGVGGSDEFYVISGGVRLFSHFGAVSSVAIVDRAEV